MNEQKIREEFLKYTSNYEESIRVNLKKNHILRVADNAKKIAISLNLTKEEIELSYLIGICHDIGRFEQVRLYDTFSDKDTNMDHAAYSNKVLFEDGLIRKFTDIDKYDSIIKKAVYNHNKLKLEQDLDKTEELQCKIIRDADKLDVLYLLNIEDKDAIYWYKDFNIEKISQKLIDEFMEEKLINYKDIHNNADQIIAFYNYIYDFYFTESYKIIKEKEYYNKYLETIKNNFNNNVYCQAQSINKFTNEFIAKKLNMQ